PPLRKRRRPVEPGEEFDGVAQFLDVDAQAMALLLAEPGEAVAAVAYLAPQAVEPFLREADERRPGLAAPAPGAAFGPYDQLQHEVAERPRFERRDHPVVGALARRMQRLAVAIR